MSSARGTASPPHSVLHAKVATVIGRLRSEYGIPERRDHEHPTDSLIGTILSQHTADRNSHAAHRALKGRYRTWDEVAEADTRELALTIRPAGLANIKAARIQAALREIQRRHGTMDLSFLARLSLDDALAALAGLPGVGPKTAACVLLFGCDLPALPVDTHVHRVSLRIGLLPAGTTADRAHRELRELVPPEDAYDFHVNMIRHGRRVCMARGPRCGVCVLQDLCDYYRKSC